MICRHRETHQRICHQYRNTIVRIENYNLRGCEGNRKIRNIPTQHIPFRLTDYDY